MKIEKICSVEILKKGDMTCDGATGARGLIDPRPVEHGCGSIAGALVPILSFKDGDQGGLPPRAASRGREGVTLITITEVPGRIETRISTEGRTIVN